MRKKTTVEVPAKSYVNEDIFCDLCGSEIKDRHEQGYDFTELDLVLRKGEQYPEGTDCVETTFDVCAACFEARVIPELVTMGLKPVKKERDW